MTNSDYYLMKVRQKTEELNGTIDVATLGKNFHTSPHVERSLVKIEEHIGKAQEEAKKIVRLSY